MEEMNGDVLRDLVEHYLYMLENGMADYLLTNWQVVVHIDHN
jgi:hypothetical protein